MENQNHTENNIVPKNSEIISFFDQDSSFVFAYKKTEKLAAAVYLVTNLFPENEPMRTTLRKKSGDLLSFILNYKDIKGSALSDFVYNAKTQVLELVSLLEISMLGGLVSTMNFSVLKTEFTNLLEVLDNGIQEKKETSKTPLSSTFFEVGTYNSSSRNIHERASFEPLHPSIVSSKGVPGYVKDISAISHDEFKRTNRQNIILGIIKKKKEVTIKDIAHVIKDCSEKTIQRELISFMEAGVLKRVGERRWSKYSLI